MGSRTSRMVTDGLPKPSRIKPSFLIPVWPDVPRRFPGVLKKDTEGFQNIAKTCRNVPILLIPLSGTLQGGLVLSVFI